MMDGNAFCPHMHGPCILLIVGSSNFLTSGAKVEQIPVISFLTQGDLFGGSRMLQQVGYN
jgi:hypothetical protein